MGSILNKLILFAFILGNFGAVIAYADPVFKGKTFKVPSEMSIRIENSTNIYNDNHVFHFGENCSMEYGGALKVLGLRPDNPKIALVTYSNDEGPAYYEKCPSGI